jgi:SEC-C motif/Helix-turn-helix domain
MNTLTPQQLRIIAAIASGTSAAQAAAAENIHRNTVSNWRRTNPDFARQLELATHWHREHQQEQIAALVPKAIQAIEDCLASPSPSIRLRAAALILKMASFFPTAESAPIPQQPAQSCTTMPKDELASFIPPPETTPGDEVFSTREAAKTFVAAQNCTKPLPVRVTPKPGRNERCPCKSGLKFKRCCLAKAA